MTRDTRLVAILCASLLLAGVCAGDDGEGNANLLYNAGFERLREGAPDGWFGSGGTVSSRAARTGERGLVLSPGGRMVALGVASVATLKYDVSGWIKAEGNANSGVRVDFYGPGNRLVGSSIIAVGAEDATGDWAQVQRRIEVPFGAQGFSVSVYNDGETVVYADDLSCREVYQARIQRTNSPPLIDGRLDDECWHNASVGNELWITTTGRVAKQQTHVFACYDDDHLYIAFRLFTRDPDGLKADETRDDFYVWRDDSAEVFIDPNHDHVSYCELEVNPNNVKYDAWGFDKNWECIWEHAVGREADAWTCEMAINLASFEYRDSAGRPTGRMMLPRPDVWGINFARNDYVSGESSSWPNTGSSFHNAPAYGHLLGFHPLRSSAYAAEAEYRAGLLAAGLERYRIGLRLPPETPGSPDDSGEAELHGLQKLLSTLVAEVASTRSAAADAGSYDDWIHVGQSLDAIGAGYAVLGEFAQPTLARHKWEDKLGRPVMIGLSLSPETVMEDGPPATWRLDDGLRVALGRDDIGGLGASIDAYADTRGVHAVVDVPGLCRETLAVVSAPGHDGRESAQWPPKGLDLAGGTRALLWAPLRTEPDARPGTYRGTVTVTASDHPPLVQGFSVIVLDIHVPRSDKLGLSALEPTFAARDITSEPAGFGATNGSAAVGVVPAPTDGECFTPEEIRRITASLAEQWERSRAARPEMRRYVLGLRDTSGVDVESLGSLYKALHQEVRGMRIMQIVMQPDPETMRALDRWVDLWAAPGGEWSATRRLIGKGDECWLFYELPGRLHSRGLVDARIQPWLARHFGADGIVWGTGTDGASAGGGHEGGDSPAGDVLPFPVFEMCCRMIAIGHRDCEYFEYLQDTLVRKRLRAKAGYHWRLRAMANTVSRIYPTALINHEWHTADYMSLLAQREASQKTIYRIERHLRPLDTP